VDDATGVVRFRGTIRQQIYSGASELLEIDCGENQNLRARIPASGSLTGVHEFVFSARDTVRVTESSGARRLSRKDHESQ
jgi:hypothetical protein